MHRQYCFDFPLERAIELLLDRVGDRIAHHYGNHLRECRVDLEEPTNLQGDCRCAIEVEADEDWRCFKAVVSLYSDGVAEVEVKFGPNALVKHPGLEAVAAQILDEEVGVMLEGKALASA